MLMVKRYNTKSNDSGVSESIGFLLIFSIVIAGIGLVTLYGYPLLLQQQVSADEKIMEKNMIVLQNDIKSLAYKTVPFKETALKIGGGSLTVYNSSYSPSSSAITIRDSGNTYVNSFQPGELRYESVSAQTDISLQNGAVVLRPRINQGSTNGSVMVAEPRWFYDVNQITNTNTMVINLINITSDNLMAKEGIGTVRMALVGEPYYNYTPGISVPIYVDYTPDPGQDYSVAWDNYIKKTFTNQPGLAFSPSVTNSPGTGSQLRYTLTPSGSPLTLVIKRYEVKIESI
jgi:hypothetical protein